MYSGDRDEKLILNVKKGFTVCTGLFREGRFMIDASLYFYDPMFQSQMM